MPFCFSRRQVPWQQKKSLHSLPNSLRRRKSRVHGLCQLSIRPGEDHNPIFISEPVYPHLYFGTMCQDRDSPTAMKKLRKSMSPQLITKGRVCSPCMISSGKLKLHMHKCIQPFPASHTYTRTCTCMHAHTHKHTM